VSGAVTAGALIPGGTVAISVAGVTVNAPIGPGGAFTAGVPTAAIAASNAPYSIAFSYAGDVNFAAATGISSLRVTDTTAPSIAAVTTTPGDLGAPNHKLIDVLVGYTSTDFSGAPSCTLSVSSNEPINGVGDGNTSIDWKVIDPHHVQLRAERAGTGSGRIYTITVRCGDSFGNASSAAGSVTVPR
jgi:hypothetical protein